MSSDAHFHQCPVIDWLKSQKTDCSNPCQDLGLIEITVLVVSCHRLIKIPKDQLFQPLSGPWSDWNNGSGGQLKSWKTECSNPCQDLGLNEKTVLVVSCPVAFMMLQTGLLLFSHRIQASGQPKKPRGVYKCMWTAGAPCFGWSKQPCIVHGQSASCFVGFIAELKVDSWSETTLQQLFHD